ncbi:hypothetical protein J6590_054339 [Homalodisca vitripennis]|nr:hypothetical protein J6590_054339 [Homalodisca vitripennis]
MQRYIIKQMSSDDVICRLRQVHGDVTRRLTLVFTTPRACAESGYSIDQPLPCRSYRAAGGGYGWISEKRNSLLQDKDTQAGVLNDMTTFAL